MDGHRLPESGDGKIWDIRERSFEFAVRVVKLCRYLDELSNVARPLVNQLIRAATSIGANLEEAQAGHSKPDFLNKNSIALKEARETRYWLRLILAAYRFDPKATSGIEELAIEAMEISRILGSIVSKGRRNE